MKAAKKVTKVTTTVTFVMVMVISMANVNAGLVSTTIDFVNSDGLGAQATFSFDDAVNSDILTIELSNTSTDVPDGFDSADQLLTSISFDLGLLGNNVADPTIDSGAVEIGLGSVSLNFKPSGGTLLDPQLIAGDDVSGEWGYGNIGTTGLLPNIVSVNASHTTAFGPTNLDGPDGLDGPQGGIAADPPLVSIGGLGVISDSVVITLALSSDLSDLSFLNNGAIVEFGSDAAFIPEPATVVLLAVGALSLIRKRRSA